MVHMAPVKPPVADPWWDYVRRSAAALQRGDAPPQIAVHGPILDHDEQARVHATAEVSRLCAGDGSYQRTSLLLVGSLGLTLGVLAAQGIVNGRRRRRAERDLIPSWRMRQAAKVLITNQRLLCPAIDGTMLSFWFDYVSEFHPNLQARSVVFAFGDECAPLRLDGAAVPALALWSAVGIYGPNWSADPRLAAVLP